jgi:hypothetical protein
VQAIPLQNGRTKNPTPTPPSSFEISQRSTCRRSASSENLVVTSTVTVSSSPSADCSIVRDPGMTTARFDSYCARKVNVLGLSGNLNVLSMEYLFSSPGGWENASGQVAQCPMCRPVREGWSCSILSCRHGS